MSFGEITIILDDVACSLHLLVKGDFQDHPMGINEEGTFELIMELLGVIIQEDTQVIHNCRGIYYMLQ